MIRTRLHRVAHVARTRRRSRALLGVLLAACAPAADEEAGDAAVPAVVGARTAVAATRPFTEQIGAIGTVVGRVGHVASLGVAAPGRIVRVLVAPGARVVRGQLLVALDASIAAATLASARAGVESARRNADRTARLVAEGIAPRREAEQATAELARATADLVTARRQTELAAVRAPIDGVVTRMTALLGATADPSQPLVEIADPSALDVVLTTTADDAGRVRNGADVALGAGEARGGSGDTAAADALGTGRVVDVGAAVDTATRTVAVRVRVGATRRPLRLGETVFGRIATATRPAVVVPAEALVPDGDGFRVFVVDRQGIAHARTVDVGGRADTVAAIRSGLAAGERVVTYGAFGVQDSARVVPLARTAP